MKNIQIKLGDHRAVIRFKNISQKNFASLKWKLIEQNIGEISVDCTRKLRIKENVETKNQFTSREVKSNEK